MLLHDRVDDHHERTGGSADLHARAAECRDHEAGDDGRVQAALGCHTARDRERYGERQGYDADNDTRDQITQELVAGVSVQRGKELRNQPVQFPSRRTGRGNLAR